MKRLMRYLCASPRAFLWLGLVLGLAACASSGEKPAELACQSPAAAIDDIRAHVPDAVVKARLSGSPAAYVIARINAFPPPSDMPGDEILVSAFAGAPHLARAIFVLEGCVSGSATMPAMAIDAFLVEAWRAT